MQEAQIFSSDPILERALETVRTDHEEARKFVADPEEYLKARGVNTEGLKFQGELSEEELERVAGGQVAEREAVAVCGGVGAIVCGSVGG